MLICLCRDVRLPSRGEGASWLWCHEFQIGRSVLFADVEDALLALAAAQPVGQYHLVEALLFLPHGRQQAQQAQQQRCQFLHIHI